MRRAARWDGAVPLFETARHGHAPEVGEVQELIAYVRDQRTNADAGPFEFVLGGATPPDAAKAKDVIGPCTTPAPLGGTNDRSRQARTWIA